MPFLPADVQGGTLVKFRWHAVLIIGKKLCINICFQIDMMTKVILILSAIV